MIFQIKFSISFALNFHHFHDFFGIDFHIDLFIHFGSKTNDLGIRFGIFWKLLARFSLLFRHIFLHRLLDALFPDFWFPLGHLGATFWIFDRKWSPKRHPFRSRGSPSSFPGPPRFAPKAHPQPNVDFGWIFDGFGMDFGWIWDGFYMDFEWIFDEFRLNYGRILDAFWKHFIY